ncbi:MAG: hydroxyethylthiazole kinase [Lachnospiraceae bacterium]|nr:hydroxyethylthiazole kinase [Lachnospiraceae bacterium]
MSGEFFLKECLETVREKKPLVHNITNYVTVNDVANMILACGASPIMADDTDEVEEITALCAGLNINIGTLNQRTIPAMLAAGKKSVSLGHATLLDPVGAGASRLRTETAVKLIHEIPFTAIRGNTSEIKALASCGGRTKGVDADSADEINEENLEQSIEFIRKVANEFHTIIAVTGAIDIVTDGSDVYVIRNGRAQMGRITGTGCQLSGLATAFLAANPKNHLQAMVTAVTAMGVAGEIAWLRMETGDGNIAYRGKIIDAICNMEGNQLEAMAKIARKQGN